MALLPQTYNTAAIEDELRRLNQRIDALSTLHAFIPQADPVANPRIGMIMYSDGSTTGFSEHKERGLYRYDYLNKDVDTKLGWIHFASNDENPFVIEQTAGDTVSYTASSGFVLLKYTGGNGSYIVDLPNPILQKYRTIRFIADGSITANHKVFLNPGGFLIDGSTADFEFNRSFEGITLFSDGSNWLVTQAKK